MNLINPYRYSQFVPSAQSAVVFAYAGNENLTLPEKIAIDRFINSQVADGNWDPTKIHCFIPLMGVSSSAASLVNWITGVSAVAIASPTYSAAAGWTVNGTTQYIQSKFIPTTGNNGATVVLDDTMYGFYMTALDPSTGLGRIGVAGSTANAQTLIFLTMSTNTIQTKNHTSNTSTFVSTLLGAGKFFQTGRIAASSVTPMYRDYQNFRNNTQAAQTVPDREMYIGANNNNGTMNLPGNGSYGSFIIIRPSLCNLTSLLVNWQYMMMELGAIQKSILYPYDRSVPSYSVADNIFLATKGQSNSLFSGAAGGPPPAPLTSIIPKTKIFWASGGIAGNPVTLDPLQYGVNHSYDGVLNLYAGGLRATYELQRRVNAQTVVWNYGKSGTGLSATDFPNDWYPTLINKLFAQATGSICTPGLDLVTGGLKMMINHWSQGEADAGANRTQAQYTADYYAFLKAEIDYLEGQGFNFSLMPMHMITPQIYVGIGGTSSQIRAAQAAFSVANFNAAYPGYGARVASWTTYSNDDLIHTDGVHMDFQGYGIEGYRLGLFFSRL